MASTSGRFISRRQKKSKKFIPLWRDIVDRKEKRLSHFRISVIGDDGTGRHTLLRRFLDMNGGPFQQTENRGGKERDILVDIEKRPHVIGRAIVFLKTSVLNLQGLDFETIYETVAKLHSFVVIFDVGRGSTLHTAIHCMVKITELLRRRAPEFILVGNKIDLPQREISAERGREVANICKAEHYYECSALMNVNMDAVLDATLIMALDQFMPFPP